jgi:hypothetical protein
MTGVRARWWLAVALLLALGSVPASAGPYLGEWSWCWHPAPGCPHGEYSPLHYWAPDLYKLRACVHPSSVDQYPPGPYPPVDPSFLAFKSPCQAALPQAPLPYVDPNGYYGLAPAAPEVEPSRTRSAAE